MFVPRAWAVTPASTGTLTCPPDLIRGSLLMRVVPIPPCHQASRHRWESCVKVHAGSASVPARVCLLLSLPSTHLVGLPTRSPPQWLPQTSSRPLALISDFQLHLALPPPAARRQEPVDVSPQDTSPVSGWFLASLFPLSEEVSTAPLGLTPPSPLN